jgi:hypothetical protein
MAQRELQDMNFQIDIPNSLTQDDEKRVTWRESDFPGGRIRAPERLTVEETIKKLAEIETFLRSRIGNSKPPNRS